MSTDSPDVTPIIPAATVADAPPEAPSLEDRVHALEEVVVELSDRIRWLEEQNPKHKYLRGV